MWARRLPTRSTPRMPRVWDIKPANLFLTSRGQVKVLDFGLAKLAEATEQLDATVTSPQNLTSPGAAMGTIAYMSPEQARGEELDGRSDLFSLGAVLYELATSKHPFPGTTSAVVFDGIMNRPPAPPTRLNPDLPAELQQVVLKVLEKDRDLRYQSAADLRADLKRLRRETESGRAASATGAAARIRPAASSGLRRALIAVGAVVVIAAAIGGYLALGGRSTGGGGINSIAVLPFTNSTNDAESDYLSDGMTEGVINSLARLQNLKVMARSTVFRFKGKEADAIQIGQQLKVQSVLTARLTRQGNDLQVRAELVNVSDGTQLWGDQFSRRASDVSELQADITREVLATLRARSGAEDKPAVRAAAAPARTVDSEAYQLDLKARHFFAQRTGDDLRKAMDYYKQAIARDPSYAPAHGGLGLAYGLAAGWGLGSQQEMMPLAESEANEALRLDSGSTDALLTLMLVNATRFDWAAADRNGRRALELGPNIAEAHYGYANAVLVPQGRWDEAIAEFRKALELDPFSRIINSNYARTLLYVRPFGETREQVRKMLEVAPDYWFAQFVASEVEAAAGNYEQARALLEKALPNTQVGPGKEGYWRAIKQSKPENSMSVAQAEAQLGNKDAAFRALEQCSREDNVSLSEQIHGPEFDPLRSDPRYAALMQRMNLRYSGSGR
jgi:eukaryotic-like serine/threonine-protein kinase